MKTILLFTLLITFGLNNFAQSRAVLPESKRDIAMKNIKPIKDIGNTSNELVPVIKYKKFSFRR
ncbi:MAG: hypothetical protein R2764_12255 [Bacteroidales bacterium]